MAPAAMLLARTYSGPALSSAATESQPASAGRQRISRAPSGGDPSIQGGGAFAAAMSAEVAADVDDGAPGSLAAASAQA